MSNPSNALPSCTRRPTTQSRAEPRSGPANRLDFSEHHKAVSANDGPRHGVPSRATASLSDYPGYPKTAHRSRLLDARPRATRPAVANDCTRLLSLSLSNPPSTSPSVATTQPTHLRSLSRRLANLLAVLRNPRLLAQADEPRHGGATPSERDRAHPTDLPLLHGSRQARDRPHRLRYPEPTHAQRATNPIPAESRPVKTSQRSPTYQRTTPRTPARLRGAGRPTSRTISRPRHRARAESTYLA